MQACESFVRPGCSSLFVINKTDLPYSVELEVRLPIIAGGVSLALARTFNILDPELKNPPTQIRERAFQIFNLLL
jgi:hypothetical protein